MPPLSFQGRVDSGRYDELAIAFDKKPDALAAVDYDTHFTAQSTGWRDRDTKNYRTTFFPTSKTPEEEPHKELVVNIIGEVAQEGSELGALGNTWLGHEKKIVDKNSVRDVLILAMPTMATSSLTILYDNQICTLETLEDNVALPVPKVRVTSFANLSPLILPLGPESHPLCPANRFRRTNDRHHSAA